MVNYTLPDFTVGLNRNLLFARLYRSNPELFFDEVRLDSVYGCFPDCVLNGGRAFVRKRATRDEMERTFEALEQAGLRARLTFTNMLATEEHLEDPYAREILDVARNHDVDVIVCADAVNELVKREYGFKRVLSTTREIADVDELNAATEAYDWVVLNYNFNKDEEFLSKIARPERVEVMVNELCTPGCPHRQEHYRHNSADQLAGRITPFRRCDLSGVDFFGTAAESPTILTDGDVRRLARDHGIRHFKIVGRGVASDVTLESYVRYLIKPRYQDAARALLRGRV